MKIIPRPPTVFFVAALILGASLCAPAKEKKTETASPEASASPMATKTMPYRGKVILIDTSATTFTVGKRAIKVTKQTKITKQGVAATMAEITVGEKVSGSYWKKDDGSLEAKIVKIGDKRDETTSMSKGPSPTGSP
jgi:hypothetical protein